MIFATAKMRQLVAVVVDKDADKVTKELLRQGALHFISIKEIEGDWTSRVDAVKPQVSQTSVGEVRKRIETYLELKDTKPISKQYLDVENLKNLNLEEVNTRLDNLSSRVQTVRDRQKQVQQEILHLDDISRQLELFGNLESVMKSRSPYSFLNVQSGTIPSGRVEALRKDLDPYPYVLMDYTEDQGKTPVMLVSMKRDNPSIEKLLDRHEWFESFQEKLGSKAEVIKDIHVKLSDLRAEQDGLKQEVRSVIEKESGYLEESWSNLRMNELYYRIQSFFSKTTRTVVFSGWLPVSKQKRLDEGIRQVTDNRCYLEWSNPEKGQPEARRNVPVLFQNPRILAPFQRLVVNYSVPEYGTVDPTPFVAIAYLVMFGLMFGDAGHGLVLALLGFTGAFMNRRKKEGRYLLMSLIGWCGVSSIITGILFGSYFGMRWFPAVWFDYHGIITGHSSGSEFVTDIYGILLITIYFGMAVIGLGLVLNWINLISKGDWQSLIFDKGGILGTWMYGAGVYVAFFFVRNSYNKLPEGNLLFFLLGLPALLMLLKPPLFFFTQKRHDPRKHFTFFTLIDLTMEWIVELLEIFSGYLANTLSFMRVAGLGIAHVSLMVAFFEIARMAGGPESFSFWSVIILIIGNVLVIGLEGLSAGIQSLRLNYYEFFSKYFRGTGKVYTPISLQNRRESV